MEEFPTVGEVLTLKSELAALEELQALDMETFDNRKELQQIPENLEAMRTDVARVGELLERERDRLNEAEQWRLAREREISVQTDLLKKSKAKLQASRSEKEMKAAQREIDTIKKTISDGEEEALKVLQAIEQYRSAIDEHTKEFAELETHLAASEKEAEERMVELKGQIAKTDGRRQEIAGRISAKTLRLYERIHKRLGMAIVEAAEGKCTGCNLEILAQRYIELQKGQKLIQCTNCFRILVFKGQPQVNGVGHDDA